MDQALGSQSEAGLRAWAVAGKSAASWPAILAGAFVAVSASLILIVLGSGLGFAAVSPWPGRGASAAGLTVTAAIWLIVTQWIAAALGGYVAGRLRTKWTGTHTHEVFFRDTAHGLITWSVATVFFAWVIAGSASSVLGGGMRAAAEAASAASAAAPGPAAEGPASAAMTYDIDRLFRSTGASPAGPPTTGTSTTGTSTTGPSTTGPSTTGPSTTGPSTTGKGTATGAPAAAQTGSSAAASGSDARIETLYIAYHAIAAGNLSDADRSYLAALVAGQTGISAPEAQRRVDEFADATLSAANKAKEGADAARKAAAQGAIYTALSLLIGAFIASVSAAIGGRLRDEHP
jgi:hypothetical protein